MKVWLLDAALAACVAGAIAATLRQKAVSVLLYCISLLLVVIAQRKGVR